MIKIPRIILQSTKRDPLPEYVVEMIMRLAPGWQYMHFNDAQCQEFLRTHSQAEDAEEEFRDISDKYAAIRHGAHRCDLFRYYFSYLNGGVYIDSDAMIKQPLDEICGDLDFFIGNTPGCGRIFNGFYGTTAKNPVIRQFLREAYRTAADQLVCDYFLFCRQGHHIMASFEQQQQQQQLRVKLLNEHIKHDHADIKSEDGVVLLTHFYKHKVIPPSPLAYNPGNSARGFVLNDHDLFVPGLALDLPVVSGDCCYLTKRGDGEYEFHKPPTSEGGFHRWAGWRTRVCGTRKKMRVSFDIRFLAEVPTRGAGFALKTHYPLRFYEDWLRQCREDEWTSVRIEIEVEAPPGAEVEELAILIADDARASVHFLVKNAAIHDI